MEASELYAEAVARLKGGWSIISIRNDPQTGQKRAACKWEPFRRRRPTPEELRRLFSRRDLTGLAAILGQVSGGLWARDFDLVEAYRRWVAAFPEMARRLPTYQTGRGFQVMAYHPEAVRTKGLGDGELRGEGVYSVLPPSLHPSGRVYAWTVGSPDAVAMADPEATGLARPWGEHGTERAEYSEKSEKSDVVEGDVTSADARGDVAPLALPDLIQEALPTEEHQNNRRLFYLARGVRGLEEAEGRQWSEDEMFKRAFLPWYTQNRFLREGQTRGEYWLEFLSAYDDVRNPLGQGILEESLRRAAISQPPAEAERFRDPRSRLLASWCRELQRAAGDGPFFLSTRTVSAKLRLGSPSRASAFLHRLVREKILAEIEKGGPSTNRATRFRYLCPL